MLTGREGRSLRYSFQQHRHRRQRQVQRQVDSPERGSALMLMPAAVLVLFLLASLAVDSALVWTAQRELANRAAAVANDVAATAIDDDHFYRSGEVQLDRAEAEVILADHLASERDGSLHSISVTALHLDGRTVRLSLSGRADGIFAPAFAGLRDSRAVYATAVVEVTDP